MQEIDDLRKAEIKYCREHPDYFVETYGHFEDKDAEELIQPFILWPMQRQALLSTHRNRLNILLKARQLGFSWLILNGHVAWLLVLFSGRTVIGMSRTEDECKELTRRLDMILSEMPELIARDDAIPPGWTGPIYTKKALEINVKHPRMGDSTFKCFPSSPGATRSFTADLIFFDEWAFQQWAEDIWTSAYPTINRPTGGRVIGLSTIERGTLFEKLYVDPDNGFNKIFVPWYADPRRTEEWYKETKRALGDDMTKEYPATVEEALTVPGGSFFPEVKADIHITDKPMEGSVRYYVAFDYGLDMLSAHWFTVDMHGRAQIYREYDKPDLTIGAAVDTLLELSEDEHIEAWLAPPDLWNRSQESGKSRAQLFSEYGLNLTKVSNDFAAGCAGMKEWLKPQADGTARLTILEGCAPNLYKCLTKIQKDKRRRGVYAKEPHELTHDCDSLRYFCVYWISGPVEEAHRKYRELPADYWEDIENAHSAEDRDRLLRKYGVIS